MSSTTHLTSSEYFDQKIQRISHALYLVTGQIDDKEPLKKSIRDLALKLIERLTLDGGSTSYSTKDVFVPLIRQTMTFVSLARTMLYISDMNGAIMLEEMQRLLERVENNEFEKKDILSDDYFIVPPPQSSRSLLHTNTQYSIQQPQKEHSFSPVSDSYKGHTINNVPITKKTSVDSDLYGHTLKKTESKSYQGGIKKTSFKSSRRNQILSLFKPGTSSITIHDVEKALPGFSIKTLQRELAQMVDDGTLRKTGEKRWSEYHLNDTSI